MNTGIAVDDTSMDVQVDFGQVPETTKTTFVDPPGGTLRFEHYVQRARVCIQIFPSTGIVFPADIQPRLLKGFASVKEHLRVLEYEPAFCFWYAELEFPLTPPPATVSALLSSV